MHILVCTRGEGVVLVEGRFERGEMLQLSDIPKIHFFFNLYSICINRRYFNLECIGYLTSRLATPDQVQHFQFAIS
jgi:hypothetical protein